MCISRCSLIAVSMSLMQSKKNKLEEETEELTKRKLIFIDFFLGSGNAFKGREIKRRGYS